MTFELENTTDTIINEIENLKLKQADVSKTCAIAIMNNDGDWKRINAAIVKRWSKSGRERVLTMAWKIVEGVK
jgi:hypothetical protein